MDPIITKMLEGVPYNGMGTTLERNALIGVIKGLIAQDKYNVDYILNYAQSVGYQRKMAEEVFTELTGLSPKLIVNNNEYYNMPAFVPNMCIAWGMSKSNKEKAFYVVPFEYGYAVMEKDEDNAPIPTIISATIPEAIDELKKVAKGIQTLDKIITKKLLETEDVTTDAHNPHQVNLPYNASPLQVLKKNFKDKVLSGAEFERQAKQLVAEDKITVDQAEDLMNWKQELIDEDESYANDTLQLNENWKPLEAEDDDIDLDSYEYLYSQLVNGNLDLYREKLNKFTKKQLIEYIEWASEMGIGREELKLNKYVQSGKKKVISKIDTLKDRLNFGYFDDETTLPKFNSLDELENYIRETNSFPDNFFYKGGLFTMGEYDMSGLELTYQSPELDLGIVVETPSNRYEHKGNYAEMEMDIYEDDGPAFRNDITYQLPKNVYDKHFGGKKQSSQKHEVEGTKDGYIIDNKYEVICNDGFSEPTIYYCNDYIGHKGDIPEWVFQFAKQLPKCKSKKQSSKEKFDEEMKNVDDTINYYSTRLDDFISDYYGDNAAMQSEVDYDFLNSHKQEMFDAWKETFLGDSALDEWQAAEKAYNKIIKNSKKVATKVPPYSEKERQRILDKFQQEYNFLYDHNDNVAGYDEAVDAYEQYRHNTHFMGLVVDLVRKRGDAFSSDREVGALMFALESLGYLDKIDAMTNFKETTTEPIDYTGDENFEPYVIKKEEVEDGTEYLIGDKNSKFLYSITLFDDSGHYGAYFPRTDEKEHMADILLMSNPGNNKKVMDLIMNKKSASKKKASKKVTAEKDFEQKYIDNDFEDAFENDLVFDDENEVVWFPGYEKYKIPMETTYEKMKQEALKLWKKIHSSKKVTAENMDLDDIEEENGKDQVQDELDKIEEKPIDEILSETTPEEYFEESLKEDKVDTINDVVSKCIDKFSEKFKDFEKYTIQVLSYNTKVLGDYEPVQEEMVEDKEINANAILQVILSITNNADESTVKKVLAVFSITNGELHWAGTVRGENDQIVAFTEEGLDALFEVNEPSEEELEDII